MEARDQTLRSDRSERPIQLTAFICERQSLSLQELTRQFQVTRRTAMRDLRSLRNAGLHIVYFPHEGGYRLVEVESS